MVLLSTLTATRIWSLSLFYFFGTNSEFTNKIINDPFHHYHIGLLLLLASYPLRKKVEPHTTAAIGLGIFLEEWPVVLSDLGLETNSLYHSGIDYLLIFGLVLLAYLVFILRTKASRQLPQS